MTLQAQHAALLAALREMLPKRQSSAIERAARAKLNGHHETQRRVDEGYWLAEVARAMDIPQDKLLVKRYTREASAQRHKAWQWLYNRGVYPTAIARMWDMDHSTVLAAIRKMESEHG